MRNPNFDDTCGYETKHLHSIHFFNTIEVSGGDRGILLLDSRHSPLFAKAEGEGFHHITHFVSQPQPGNARIAQLGVAWLDGSKTKERFEILVPMGFSVFGLFCC
jgi:hypothetical protein